MSRESHRAVQALLLQFLRSLRQSLQDLLPIILVIGFFQLVVLRQPIPNLGGILWGAVLVLLGLDRDDDRPDGRQRR